MPKAPRHRKRTRTARIDATSAPTSAAAASASAAPSPDFLTGSNGHVAHSKKVGKKEAEVTNLLDKLKSVKVEERVWASSALSSLLLSLPPVTLRLLLSKNLIGLLIERLSDAEDDVVVECLGALRNLAVSSPPSILSEMHNKRLLLPLLTLHMPMLLQLLPSLLVPAVGPVTAALPSTAAAREQADISNERTDKRRRLYWDWAENVIMLLWCCAESNTKILSSLNAAGAPLIDFLMAFLDANAIGIADEADQDGMDVEGKKGKKVKRNATAKKERVPLFVAVTAAQTLHALISSNLPAHAIVLASPLLPSLAAILSTSTLPAALAPTRTESHRSTVESDTEDYLTLRVLCFGAILELAQNSTKKGRQAKQMKEEMMEVLKNEQGCLMGGLKSDLQLIAKSSIDTVAEMGPISDAPSATPSSHALKLASYEKNLSTLQLSLEILSGWCATLDASSLGGLGFGDDEEWGGIAQDEDMEDGDMVDDEEEDAVMGSNDAQVHERDGSDEEEDEEDEMGIELTTEALQLASSLPQLLLSLALPTPISFLQPPTQSTGAPKSAADLIPTAGSASPAFDLPLPLAGVADIITTIHVRALECSNNLYITLARSSSFLDDPKNATVLQHVWAGTMELVLGASIIDSEAVANRKELEKSNGEAGDDVEERRMEMMMAGVGACWGMSRVGLRDEGPLIVGPSATPFLISIFSHPFAMAATPAAEAIRVRIVGILGWIGRRESIDALENEMIGTFLLTLLPSGKVLSPFLPTPEVLLQAIDSLIDIYSDENSGYDAPVFVAKGFLDRFNASIAGVRGATKKIDRKKFPELRTRADGALENLVGFVEYRRGISMM